jgi:uncharacterized protein YgbK (DUF1537 family)
MSLAILADDLTGACDTGSLFTKAGAVPAMIWPACSPPGEVHVVDTESRRMDAATAASRVRDAARGTAARQYFKKIDSTFRGRIGAEVEALMTSTGLARALVCPAFPAQRRVVRDRVLLVGGAPVAGTAIACDPSFPAGSTSSLVDLLRPQLARPIGWVPLAEVRAGCETLAARLTRLEGVVTVADAETDADLEALVDAALSVTPAPLLVGAAGLARALAARIGLLRDRVALPPVRRWLVIAGSRHPASRRQAEVARLAGLTVLVSPDTAQDDPDAVARELAADALRSLAPGTFDIVAVTGGDTAVALYRALGAERLDLVGAPAPGLALGRLRAPRHPDLWLVTKAGGFGDPDVFVTLARTAAA